MPQDSEKTPLAVVPATLVMTWSLLPASYWNPLSWDDADVNGPNKIQQMIERCYAPVGGWPGAFEALIAETNVWLVLDPKDPRAIIFGKRTPFGVKWICMAAESGSKRRLLGKLVTLGNTLGNYAEFSDRLGDFLINRCPQVRSPGLIARVLGKTIEYKGDGWYERALTGGLCKRKILLGRPVVELAAVYK